MKWEVQVVGGDETMKMEGTLQQLFGDVRRDSLFFVKSERARPRQQGCCALECHFATALFRKNV
jgi:hypothetical protein